ncbi:MAG: phenylalanine--tRNA ligase subunit alpha [Fimbriimonas ginsengisoli]|uniref:Phenylalanine--tRNA ligase alpha subunit n=1 Tax=Fimbriimonas ginsengisoli TaxID=1005039 RepID=A0A931LRT7_FIMGI|nr:phenylalanine--tRNA ligase subunit alpha [Fimbriimonas ginsengisoli]
MRTVEELEAEATAEIGAAARSAELRDLEIKYLGKSGLVTGVTRLIGALPAAEKPLFGQKVNEIKQRLQALIESRERELKSTEHASQFEAERIDVTMPGRLWRSGQQHVLQQAMNKIKAVLSGLGFQYHESPDLELAKYNFDALNYPKDHPAMDEQDTFWIDDERLLRTQATALQGRIFEVTKPPLRAFAIGRCFRNEAVDRTHSHTFHQVDAFMVDEGISMADLKGTLGHFARSMFGGEVKVRFRPDFFPFVEPGVDYAISSPKVFGGQWLELGGAGLIHPNILERYDIDTKRYSGFAFGLGVERIPMIAHGIEDLRPFLENDLRFLGQFHG